MKQINDHTSLPFNVNIDFIGSCEIRGKGNKRIDSSDCDTYVFIETACNNFYKMKDMISDLATEMFMTRDPLINKMKLKEAEQLLKELDK